jgi:hypothetical protein
MSIPSSTRALLATATVALLSACSGASQLAPSIGANTAASQSQAASLNAGNTLTADIAASTPKNLVWAADNGGDVYEYNRSGQDQTPLQTLTTGLHFPYGMYIGASPNPDLFISNEGDSNILVYGAPTYTTNTFTYNDAGQLPNSVAQCGNYVYAGNLLDTGGNIGSATAFTLGKAKAIKTVSSSNYVNVTGIACDPKTGNVYVAFLYSYAGPGGIDQYAPGLAGKATTLPMDPAFPAGITVDKAGDILVCEAFAGTIEYYHPTVADSFKEVKGFSSPAGVALEKSDTYMWVADQQAKKLYRVQIKTGKIVDTITKPGYKSLAGVATVPADH